MTLTARSAGGPSRGDPRRAGRCCVAKRRFFCPLAVLLTTHGCTDVGSGPIDLQVRPSSAYSDLAMTLVVNAPALRPALAVDIVAETAQYEKDSVRMSLVGESPGPNNVVPLSEPRWDGASTYLTIVPAGTAPGVYGLRIDTENGHSTTVAGAFQELGRDTSPPTLIVNAPMAGWKLPQGGSTMMMIFADDGPGQLAQVSCETSAGVGQCDLPANPITGELPSQVSCMANCPVPAVTGDVIDPEPFTLQVVATDVAGQSTTVPVPLFAANLPSVTGFDNTVGAVSGNQVFTVRGQYFLPGSQALLDGIPLVGPVPGGDRVDDTTIVGMTPPHGPGAVPVEVQSAAGTAHAMALFRYMSPPRPRAIQPAVGPSAGGIRVTIAGNDLRSEVIISLGTTLENAQPLRGATAHDFEDKVVGCLPPGQGTVSVWAYDPVTGFSSLPDSFTYQDAAGDAGVLLDPTCTAGSGP